jgi:hypothetical protein
MRALLSTATCLAVLAGAAPAHGNEAPGSFNIAAPPIGEPVDTFTPTLTVYNTTDPDDDVLRYQFEVHRNPGLTTLVAATSPAGVAEGPGDFTSWEVEASPPLQEGVVYYWQARAVDPGNLASPWSPTGSFLVATGNAPPASPTLVAPANASTVAELRPALTLLAVTDPDGDPVVYDWDLATDGSFAKILDGGVDAAGPGFALAPDLTEDSRYCWRARADDGHATSTYAMACFRVSQQNDPPSIPTLTRPTDALAPTSTAPLFVWEPSTDPEEDPVRYDIEVRDGAGELAGVLDGVEATETFIGRALTGGLTYTWRVRAIDRGGAASEYAAPMRFTPESPDSPTDGCCHADGGCHTGASPGTGATAIGLGLGLIALARRRRRP